MSWNDFKDAKPCWGCGRLEVGLGGLYRYKDLPADRWFCNSCSFDIVSLLIKEKDILPKLDKESYKLFMFYKKREDKLMEMFFLDLPDCEKPFFGLDEYKLVVKKLNVKERLGIAKFFRIHKALERDYRSLVYQHEILKSNRKSSRETWLKKISEVEKKYKVLLKENKLLRKNGLKKVLKLEKKVIAKVITEKEKSEALLNAEKLKQKMLFKKAGLIPLDQFEEKLKGVVNDDASKKC